MKTIVVLFAFLSSVLTIAQVEADKDITISKPQGDDLYLAAETVHINALVDGDVVAAGSSITVRDSIRQDLILAGGDIAIKGYVADDIRVAGGSNTIDSEIGDDIIIFGGEVDITEDAIVHGNLISFSGKITIDGEVKGNVKAYGGDLRINGKIGKDLWLRGADVKINGQIEGVSEIVAEDISIGSSAKFGKDVNYWSEDGEVDFGNSLAETASATFDKTLMDVDEFSWKIFGIAAVGFWIFYILSAFIILLILNMTFKNLFSKAVSALDTNIGKSIGYGFIYLLGLPLLIAITFLIIIGIPIGLFLLFFYFFSLVFGHLVVSLLITHYLNRRNEKNWNFWTIVFLALIIAASIRLITFIPILGAIISIFIIAIGYGLLFITLRKNKISISI